MMTSNETQGRDYIDQLLEQWNRERPDLDLWPMGIIARISRASHLFQKELESVFSSYELHRGRFDVLAALRRAGSPNLLSPTALYNSLLISSGAMTHRLERLENTGLIERIPDPNDGRGLLVRLTEQGLQTIDEAVTSHTKNEQKLLATLTEGEKEILAAVLRKILLMFGDRPHAVDSISLDAHISSS